ETSAREAGPRLFEHLLQHSRHQFPGPQAKAPTTLDFLLREEACFVWPNAGPPDDAGHRVDDVMAVGDAGIVVWQEHHPVLLKTPQIAGKWADHHLVEQLE